MTRKPASLQAVEVVILALLLVVIVGQSAYLLTYVTQSRKVQDRLVCQTQINTAFRESLTVRTESAGRERDAQRQLLTSLRRPVDRAVVEDAYARYFAVLDQADRDRDAHPLPDITC